MTTQDAIRLEQRRLINVRTTARLLTGIGLVGALAYGGLGVTSGSWQQFVQAGVLLTVFVMAVLTLVFISRGRVALGAALLVAVPYVVGLGLALIISDYARSLIPSVILVAMAQSLARALAPPERRRAHWVAAIALGVSTYLLAQIPVPWEKLEAAGTTATSGAARVLVFGAIAIAVIWQAVQWYRRLLEIRTRLVATSTALVLGVAATVSITSIVMQGQVSQDRAFEQLRTTATLKAQSVDVWADQRRFALESLLVESFELQRAEAVLLRNLTADDQRTAGMQLRLRFSELIRRTGWFTEIFLVGTDGQVVLSTVQAREGRDVGDRLFFSEGMDGLVLTPPTYDAALDEVTVVLARPLELGGFTYGILAARADVSQLGNVIAAGQVGLTGNTSLIGADGTLLTLGDGEGAPMPVESEGIAAALRRPSTVGVDTYASHTGRPVSGAYVWLPPLRVAMVVEQDQSELQAGTLTASIISGGVGVLSALGAVVYALAFSASISRPLSSLAAAATQAAAGDLEVRAEVVREDEIGAVAGAFNEMTAQLRDLIAGLEQRVAERTRGLEAVAEVSRATTSVLDPDQLLPQVVDLVQESFGLYYVGLFLFDEARDYAVLRAGTGTAGVEMISRDWRLPAGSESMIGRCVVTGEAQIMQRMDAREDDADTGLLVDQGVQTEVRFDNPWLPETRSELALPLRYGGRVVGAMTVQSTDEGAFGQTDIATLQNLADQVAVAVENARLFAETQVALDRARRAQRRFEQQAWSEYLGARAVTGYEQTSSGTRVLEQTLLGDVQRALASETLSATATPSNGQAAGDGRQVLIPIKQADQVIGVVGVEREDAWTAEDAGLVRNLAEQLSLAAENQRLLDVTQRREAAERLVREVATRMREPVELEDVMRTAADEIRAALGTDWVVVRLVEPGRGEEG